MRVPKAEKLPSGKWRSRITIHGERVSFIADTDEEAVSMALLHKLTDSKDKIEQRKAHEILTVSGAIDQFIRERDGILSPSTIRSYKSIRDNRLQAVMDRPLSDNINWQSVINEEAKHLSPKTVKNIWGLLSSVLKANNIEVGNILLPQIVRKEHEFLQPEQIKVLLKAMEGHRFELPYLLCLHGLRRSEVCAVKKSNIKDGYILVRGAMVYNDRSQLVERKQNKTTMSNRDVPIMFDRLTILANQCATEYLCPFSPSSLCHPLNTICRQNELPEIGLHGLRHSYASLCYHLGLSEQQTMELGGWSDPSVMRKIYTHLADTDRKSAEEKLRNFFG